MPHVVDEMDHPDNWHRHPAQALRENVVINAGEPMGDLARFLCGHSIDRIVIGLGFVRYESWPEVVRWTTADADAIGTGYMLGVKR